MRRIGNTGDLKNEHPAVYVSYHFYPVLCKNTFRRYFAVLTNITLLKYFICQHEEQVFSDILPPRTMLLAAKGSRKVKTEAAVPA